SWLSGGRRRTASSACSRSLVMRQESKRSLLDRQSGRALGVSPPPLAGEELGRGYARRVARFAPSPPLPRTREREQTECAREECALTHPGKPHLLALVERLVEARKRGADGGGGGAHGGKALAHRLHAPDRGERGLGGAGGRKRVGGFERRGDEL